MLSMEVFRASTAALRSAPKAVMSAVPIFAARAETSARLFRSPLSPLITSTTVSLAASPSVVSTPASRLSWLCKSAMSVAVAASTAPSFIVPSASTEMSTELPASAAADTSVTNLKIGELTT